MQKFSHRAPTDYWCPVPEDLKIEYDDWKRISTIPDKPCHYYSLDWNSLLEKYHYNISALKTSDEYKKANKTMYCEHREFDRSFWKRTTIQVIYPINHDVLFLKS